MPHSIAWRVADAASTGSLRPEGFSLGEGRVAGAGDHSEQQTEAVHYVTSRRSRPAANRRTADTRTAAEWLQRCFWQKHSDPCPLLSSIHTLPTMNGLMCILSVHVRTTFSNSESTGGIHSRFCLWPAQAHRSVEDAGARR